ncbi:hypothetical protein OG599_29750 [Streptomyces sp. NBC_01335]|uniref:hypothetical protein n=1 Tax=Streptomyces sp. NBC_01335 TaxID=2903828 RepID=UPI002E10CDB5|nr:hypothetical protein OG599_29750 [Streptomyces sp. NBC_01335]
MSIQFHFGDTYHHKYRVGDTISWSDRAIGSPRKGRFEIPGYPEWCQTCKLDDEGYYLVQFDGDVIIGYREATEGDMESFDW